MQTPYQDTPNTNTKKMFSSSFLLQPPSPHPHHTYQIYNIDDDENSGRPVTPPSPLLQTNGYAYPTMQQDTSSSLSSEAQNHRIPYYSHQAITAHNRRMIIPYKKQPPRIPGSRNNRVISSSGMGLSSMRDEPLVMYRFFEFYCGNCEQSWVSPLYRAKDGLFCRICHQFCQPRGIRHCLTPYMGKEQAYGKYFCHHCHRGFSSYKSLSNCPDQCFACGTLVYPYYQIAHSVLYQKIRKNDITTNGGGGGVGGIGSDDSSRRYDSQTCSTSKTLSSSSTQNTRLLVRKINSGIIKSASNPRQCCAKKRLHCLNNNVQLNNQVGRRHHHQNAAAANLKCCYSEPTIGNNASSLY